MWLNTELINCPLCGEKEFNESQIRSDGLHIVKCRKCSLAYLNPRPVKEDIGKLYEKDYYSSNACDESSFRGMPASRANIKFYKPYAFDILADKTELNGKRTLDIGCSYGKWVYWMAKYGANATGIDLAEQCVQWGKKEIRLDLRQTDLSTLDEPDESFDIITMIDLIEHLSDLSGTMKSVNRLLKPGGMVFVQTPNFQCVDKYGKELVFLHFGMEHLLYFEAETLDRLFADYSMRPYIETSALCSIAPDREGTIRHLRGFKRKLGMYLLKLPGGLDFIHKGISAFLTKKQVYNYDETKKSGAILIGCYIKSPCGTCK